MDTTSKSSQEQETASVLGRVLLYVHDVDAIATFYSFHFGFQIHRETGDRIVELESPNDHGNNIMLHPLGRARKSGQTLVKLVFDVQDVERFHKQANANGLSFGKIFQADGYTFANAKDPAGNSISISSRTYRPKRP